MARITLKEILAYLEESTLEEFDINHRRLCPCARTAREKFEHLGCNIRMFDFYEVHYVNKKTDKNVCVEVPKMWGDFTQQLSNKNINNTVYKRENLINATELLISRKMKVKDIVTSMVN